MQNIHDLNRQFLTVAKHTISVSKEKAIMLLNLTQAQCDAIDKLSFSQIDEIAKTDVFLFNMNLSADDLGRLTESDSPADRMSVAVLSQAGAM